MLGKLSPSIKEKEKSYTIPAIHLQERKMLANVRERVWFCAGDSVEMTYGRDAGA